MTEDPQPPRRDGWRIAGIVLAWVVGLTGLFAVGAAILFAVALNSYGSNK